MYTALLQKRFQKKIKITKKLDQTSVFKEWNINDASTEANEGKNA